MFSLLYIYYMIKYEVFLERKSFDENDFEFKSKDMKNLTDVELEEYLHFFSEAFGSFEKNIYGLT